MAVISYIDAINRRIYLHADTVGVDLEPMEIYKEMRTLRSTTESLREFDVFLRAFGNVPKGGGKSTERYVRCELGTRIVPYDVDQNLVVIGTIITDDGQEGKDCFDRTGLDPSTNVNIDYIPPQVEVITVQGGSGLSTEQDDMLREIHSGSILTVHVDATNPSAGDGSPSNPFNLMSNAMGYASARGLRSIHVHSALTLDADVLGMDVQGLSVPTINLNGFDVTGSTFREFRLSGTGVGEMTAQKCFLMDGLSGMHGIYWQCALGGDLVVDPSGYAIMAQCFSGIAGSGRPSISLSNSAIMEFTTRGYDGGFSLTDTVAGSKVTLGFEEGECRLESSVTGGDIHIRGVAYFENLGTATPITRSLHNPSDPTIIVDATWAYERP